MARRGSSAIYVRQYSTRCATEVWAHLARFDERYLQSGVRLGKSSSDDGASCATLEEVGVN